MQNHIKLAGALKPPKSSPWCNSYNLLENKIAKAMLTLAACAHVGKQEKFVLLYTCGLCISILEIIQYLLVQWHETHNIVFKYRIFQFVVTLSKLNQY